MEGRFHEVCDVLSESELDLPLNLAALYLKPVSLQDEPASAWENLLGQEALAPNWRWIDPKEDSVLTLLGDQGVQIQVPPAHHLKPQRGLLDAPRLLLPLAGDFVVETRIADGDEGQKSGGLLVWQDEQIHVRLEFLSSATWEGDVQLIAYQETKWFLGGGGRLENDSLTLRLERRGDRFTGYVSADGESWFRCGWIDLPMEDPIQVGIHALCPYSSPTSTRFAYFRVVRT